jgi:hypothetical protein
MNTADLSILYPEEPGHLPTAEQAVSGTAVGRTLSPRAAAPRSLVSVKSSGLRGDTTRNPFSPQHFLDRLYRQVTPPPPRVVDPEFLYSDPNPTFFQMVSDP